ncbi:MAG: FG-GAP repeat domain-containing protein [Acidimicrobiia bacterium]
MTRFRALAGSIVAAAVAASVPITVVGAPPAFAANAWSHGLGATKRAAPTVADINGDGQNEILVGDLGGTLHVYRGDGSIVWERGIVPLGTNSPVAIESAPTVADIDGDGRPEIIMGVGSPEQANQPGGIVVLDGAGNTKWRFQPTDIFNEWNPNFGTRPDGYAEGVWGTPAVGDVNGDGAPEVVFAALDNRIWVLRGDGSLLPGWTTPGGTNAPVGNGWWVDDAVWGSVGVYDGDGDGRDEIYVGVDGTPGGSISVAGGVVVALEYEGGRAQQQWIRAVGDVVQSSPAIGDINGDGRPELVIGAGNFNYNNADTRRVFAFHLDDGSTVPGWPQTTGGATLAQPALGDVNGDGIPEVVTTSGDANLYVWKGDGSLLQKTQVLFPGFAVGFGGPMIADLDGNGSQDIRTLLDSTPAVGDFGSLGWMYIVVEDGKISGSPIPTPGAAPEWPMARQNAQHTGVARRSQVTCPSVPGGGSVGASALGTYHTLNPARVLDTRTGNGATKARLRARCTLPLDVLGRAGVPGGGVNAVVLNLTIDNASADGYATAYPCGTTPPNASNLNYVAGQTVANLVVARLGAQGKVCIFTWGSADVVADVAGWYGGSDGSRLTAQSPERLRDTRVTGGTVPAGGTIQVPVGSASAVALNITAIGKGAPGYLSAFPCGGDVPLASNVNYSPQQIVANHSIVRVGTNDSVCIYSYAAADVVVDLMGRYGQSGDRFAALPPTRLYDSRATGPLGANQTGAVTVVGVGGVPGGIGTVLLNVTAVDPQAGGYFTVFPCDKNRPLASNLNYTPGHNVPNLVTAQVGANGQVCIYSFATAQIVIDTMGYFAR